MSRPGRLALYLLTAVTVVGLSKAHAVTSGYVWSGSSRFAWSLFFIGMLCLGAYAFGLPEQARTRKRAVLSAVCATFTAAAVVSLVQLVAGDALLPRFVVFGSVVVLVPCYVLCAALSVDVDARSVRDRVLVVAMTDELESLEGDLEHAPERSALIVGWLTSAEAESGGVPPRRPLVETATATDATVVVLSRAAQSNDDIVLQASQLHQDGVRIRTLSLFYEQWLGKLPLGELERVSLLFDIGEVHAAWYGRVKRLLDIGLALVGCVALAIVTPLILFGDLVANRARSSTGSLASVGTARPSTS